MMKGKVRAAAFVVRNKFLLLFMAAAKPLNQHRLFRKELVKALESEAFYSHVLTLIIDGKAQQAGIKSIAASPCKKTPMHADFLRVDAAHKITMRCLCITSTKKLVLA
jgi:ribosomal protein L25 (general stress protein Ctc)